MAALRPPVALMLARDEAVVPAPSPRWVFEPKMDGWRAALFTRTGFVQSRRDNNLADRFPEIAGAGRALGDVVLDGELVALQDGRLDFGALTSSPGSRADLGVTIYYIFTSQVGWQASLVGLAVERGNRHPATPQQRCRGGMVPMMWPAPERAASTFDCVMRVRGRRVGRTRS